MELMPLDVWADQFFHLSEESSSTAGQWVTLPYQRGIMRCLSNDDVQVLTWKKSARTGYTKIINCYHGYCIEHLKRSGVIYQPTDGDAAAFVKEEINPSLRDVPVVRAKFPAFGKKSEDNTLEAKKFLGSAWSYLGGKTARNFRRLTKDSVIYDETDGFDKDIEGEGDPFELGDVRVKTSNTPKSVRGSTPKDASNSLIEQSYQDADVRLKYFVRCPCCGGMAPLAWGGPDANYGFKWDGDDQSTSPDTVRYQCGSCGNDWGYHQLAEAQAHGEWRSEEDGTRLDAEGRFWTADGEPMDAPRHVAFHLWAGYSLFFPWSDLVRDWLKANRKAKTGDVSALKTFVNTMLGDVWEGDQGEQLEWEQLYNRREHYGKDFDVPWGGQFLTAGVDVQLDRIEYTVVAWGYAERCWVIHHERLYGNPTEPAIWNALGDMLRRPYRTEDGRELYIGRVALDSGYLADDVYGFCRRNNVQWAIPVKGVQDTSKPVADFPRKRNKKGVYLTMVGTTNAKDTLNHRLSLQQEGPGYIHFPRDVSRNCDEEYFKQLVAERKVPRTKDNRRVFVWELPSGHRCESWDTLVYNLAAFRVSKQHFGLMLEPLGPMPESVVESASAVAEAEPVATKPERVTQSRKSTPAKPGSFIR